MDHKHISKFSLHISTNYESLTPLEKNMLADLSKRKEEFNYDNFTIAHISEVLNASTTSLHRLSKKLGYASFKIMKEDFFADRAGTHETNESENNYLSMINNSYYLVKNNISTKMLEVLSQEKRIVIYGMGMNSYVAKIFEIKLQLLGISSQHYDDSRFMKLSSHSLNKEEDVVIVLSRTGCPPELIEVMLEVNKRDIPSVLITEVDSSPIESMSTYVIHTSYAIDLDDDIDTRINTHIALDVLIREMLNKKKGHH